MSSAINGDQRDQVFLLDADFGDEQKRMLLGIVLGLGERKAIGAAAADEVSRRCAGLRAQLHVAAVNWLGDVVRRAGPADAGGTHNYRSLRACCLICLPHATEVTHLTSRTGQIR
ncbi:hypothetical protein [Mycolicibacterium grossiae]|uniref:Uncharacterized protein n=1 Tax=Mycolicibacterium grossiae TaxID=1552759 RepID=A0A1E8Q7L8_9MYCO|nr:hypothetical protein [Mycolicibacterium grossiae]OFJ54603.1 hypothetical protein BEL07_06590 [Mycolicibacterium grossiae]